MRKQWAGLLALFLVLTGAGAYAAFDPIGGDGDVDACFERKTGDLDLLKGKRCGKGEKPIAWDAADSPAGSAGEAGAPGPQGPPGPAGAQGTQGQQGVSGAAAASMLTGRVGAGLMPGAGSDSYFVPSGDAEAIDEGGRSPNATVVLRDLHVEVDVAPGFGTSWEINLGDSVGPADLNCSISGTFDTACDSGGQTSTIPAGQPLEFNVRNMGGAGASDLTYGYRAVTP